MKVKLKKDRMDKKNGLTRMQLKALNRGEIIDIDIIPKEANSYLVKLNNKKKGDK